MPIWNPWWQSCNFGEIRVRYAYMRTLNILGRTLVHWAYIHIQATYSPGVETLNFRVKPLYNHPYSLISITSSASTLLETFLKTLTLECVYFDLKCVFLVC